MSTNEEELQALVFQSEQALLALYNDQNQTNRSAAHKWLLEIQKSHQAWQLCWKLMQSEKPPEVQFFGASMLHFKISKSWNDLQEDHYESLRSEIFKHILGFSSGPKIVLTRLCIALGRFALHTMQGYWPNAIDDIVSTFQNAASSQDGQVHYHAALLEVLTVLPEEFQSTELLAEKRVALRSRLEAGRLQFLQIIQQALVSTLPVQLRLQALRGLISWVQFGTTISDIVALVPVIFESIENNDLFDTAVDLLVEISTQPSTHKFPTQVWSFLSAMLQFSGILRKALESGDSETASGLCRVLVSVAETHSKLLLNPGNEEQQHLVFGIVQLILECTGAPGCYPVDEQCSEMTFYFWYILQEDITAAEPQAMQRHISLYGPLFLSLCQVFLRKVQYPSDEEWRGFTADEKENFRCYRQDIADTMMYVYCVMRVHCLHFLHSTLSALLAEGASPSWQVLDAAIYLTQAVSEYVDPDEETYVPAILSLLPRLPSHPFVSQAALLMVGAYSEWLKCHPAQLRSVLPILLSGLSRADLAEASTLALRGVCEECVQDLEPDSLQQILAHCQASLVGDVLKNKERIRCVECIGHALSVQESPLAAEQAQVIFTPLIERLGQLSQQQPSVELKHALRFHLHVFAVLCKCLDPDESCITNQIHPESFDLIHKETHWALKNRAQVTTLRGCVPDVISVITGLDNAGLLTHEYARYVTSGDQVVVIFSKILPALKSLSQWTPDNDVMQSLSLCLERAISSARDFMTGALVQELCDLVLTYFSAAPHNSLLDAAALLVGMHGTSEEHLPGIKEFFQKMASATLELLRANIREHPFILQSFMGLVVRALRTDVRIVFDHEGIPVNIFQCGIALIGFPESHTVRAGCNFFVNFVRSACEGQPVAKQCLEAYGEHLVRQTVTGIGGGVPRQCTDFLAEILLSLNKLCPASLSQWLQGAMQIDGFPSNLVSQPQKQQFVKSVLRERVHKRRLKDAVTEFSLLCRGLEGTGYACA